MVCHNGIHYFYECCSVNGISGQIRYIENYHCVLTAFCKFDIISKSVVSRVRIGSTKSKVSLKFSSSLPWQRGHSLWQPLWTYVTDDSHQEMSSILTATQLSVKPFQAFLKQRIQADIIDLQKNWGSLCALHSTFLSFTLIFAAIG